MSVTVEVTSNNKRMLQNTLVLYVRMMFTMGIGFYATRELLFAIGVVDFGLVNVIGSVVLMFSFLSGTMQATVSRYLSTDIGLKDTERLRDTFNLTLLIYFALIVIIVSLSETIGLWLFENKLVVPDDRKVAAYWFFQFSLITFVVGVLAVPYSALLISHEKIKVYAWIGTVESIGRLLIVFVLYFDVHDRLALYGALLAVVAFGVFGAYVIYCHRNYTECRLRFFWNADRCKDMLLFAAWNLWGALSGLFSNVFVNVLLNNYFGSVVNAARGIAMQGATGVSNFVTNFLTAVRPQIFKYYAEGRTDLAVDLTMRSARGGYFLLFFFSLPVLLEMPFVLDIWLRDVPQNAGLFMRLILIQRLIDILAYPLVTLSQANGKVALYQSVVGVMQWAVFPISWVALDLGFGAESVFWIGIALSVVALVAQFYLINRVVSSFSINKFLMGAVYPALSVSLASIIVPAVVHYFMPDGWWRFLVVCALSFTCASIFIYILGVNSEEKRLLRAYVLKKMRRDAAPA